MKKRRGTHGIGGSGIGQGRRILHIHLRNIQKRKKEWGRTGAQI